MSIELANWIKRLPSATTFEIAARVQELRNRGEDIINFNIGEPDFNTPNYVKEAAKKAIDANQTRYTPVDGIKALKQAVQRKFIQENSIEYELDEITVSNGAKHVLYNALMALIEEGDKVIIPAPYWVSYPAMVKIAGGKPVFVDTSKTGFKLTPHDLEEALTPKVKILILNSPNNPSGAAYSINDLGALAKVLIDHPDVLIICDDIYEHIIFDNFTFVSLARVAPELKDRILTVNSVSKSFAMTGWRIGYAGGPSNLIKAMNKLQSQSTSNPCTVAQYAALEALTHDKFLLVDWCEIYNKRRDLALQYLSETPGITCFKPNGGFYLFPSCSEFFGYTTMSGHVINTDEDFCEYLLTEGKVAAVPGSAFGTPGYFRISFAVDIKELEKGMARIQAACTKLTPNS